MKKMILQKSIAILAIASLFFTNWVFAAPPGSLYVPGETTAPTCAPWDTNCDVDLSSIDNQILTLSGTTLIIADGNSVDLSDLYGTGAVFTDSQTLSLSGSLLIISDGNNVDLSSYLDNTDSQSLSLSGSNLSISGGNTLTLPSMTDTDDQTLSLSGNTLTIADGNSVDLSPFTGTGTDSQTLTLSGSEIVISDGNSVDISSLLTGTGTDSQTLLLSGSLLSVSGGNVVDLSTLQGTSSLSWATDTDLTGSATGSTLYFDGTNWVDLDLWTQDQILTSSWGQLIWSTPDSMSFTLSGATDTNLTSQGTGSLLYFDGSEWIDLDAGTPGQKLVVGTGWVLEWVTDSTTSVTLGYASLNTTLTSNVAVSSNVLDLAAAQWLPFYDSSSLIDVANDRVTAQQDAIYEITFHGGWQSAAASYLAIEVDGSEVSRTTMQKNGGNIPQLSTSWIGDITTGQHIRFLAGEAVRSPQITIKQLPTTAWVGVGGGWSADLDGLTDTNLTSQGTGSLLYFDGTDWIDLPKGTAGQSLVMNTGATAPEWAGGTQTAIGSAYYLTNGSPSTAANTIHNFGTNVDERYNDLGSNVTYNGDGTWTLRAGTKYKVSATILPNGNITHPAWIAEASAPTVKLGVEGYITAAGISQNVSNILPLVYNTGVLTSDITIGVVSSNILSTYGNGSRVLIEELPTTAWVGVGWSGTGATTLDELTDTNLTTPVNGSLLYFDGTEWVDLDAGTPGQKLVAGTGGTLEWVTDSTTSVELHYFSAIKGTFTTLIGWVIPLSTLTITEDGSSMRSGNTLVIPSDGKYKLSAGATPHTAAGELSINVNGLGVALSSNAGSLFRREVRGIYDLNAGDIITYQYTNSTANNLWNIVASAEQLPTTAWVGVGWAGGSDFAGLTDGSIPFANGGAAAQDNSNLFWDDTNNRLGIGTSGPLIDLAIGDNDTGFEQVSDGELAVYTNNTERVRFDDTGRVGIGEVDPDATLDLVGSFQFTDGNQAAGRVLTSDANGNATWQAAGGGGSADGNGIVSANATIGAGRTVGLTDTVNFDSDTFVIDGTNNRVAVGTAGPLIDLAIGDADTGIDWLADGEFSLKANAADKVKINGAGVSINTSESALIDLAIGDADTGIEQTADGVLDFMSNGTAVATVKNGSLGIATNDPQFELAIWDDDTGIDWFGDGSAALVSNGAQKVRLHSNGIAINSSSDGDYELTFDSDTGIDYIADGEFELRSNSIGLVIVKDQKLKFGSTTIDPNDGNTNFDNAVCWHDVQNGNFDLGTIRLKSTGDCINSSERYKHNIQDLIYDRSMLSILDELRPVSFQKNGSDEYRVGFIAEEIELIDDRIVDYNSDGLVDGFDDKGLMGIITWSLKELYELVMDMFSETNDRVAQLEMENAELKERLEAIEAKLQ